MNTNDPIPFHRLLLLVSLLAVSAACADAGDDSMDDDPATAVATVDESGDEPMAEQSDGAVSVASDASGLLNVNGATADQLRAAGVPDAAVAALLSARPFDDMLAVDATLADVLDEAGRESAYRSMWIPLDLNAASREEILLIPGVGNRMAGEFEEYRPYESIEEFRREIGKYVDDDELERLTGYVTLE